MLQVVRDHPSLETLILTKNGIGERGLLAMADMLAGNSSLTSLQVCPPLNLL
jgi:hypothetical protein